VRLEAADFRAADRAGGTGLRTRRGTGRAIRASARGPRRGPGRARRTARLAGIERVGRHPVGRDARPARPARPRPARPRSARPRLLALQRDERRPCAPSPRAPTPRERECAASLGLPFGPVASCRDALLATAITVTAVTGFVAWWHRGLDTQFDVAHEGWFGADTYSGGIDKLGHGFSFYVGTRMLNRGFGWAGMPADESLPLSIKLAVGLGLGIETLDALARGGKYGFSWEDLVMDSAGIALGWLAETQPAFDRWFAFRWLHASAGDPQRRYDHHQYYAVLRLSGWSALEPWNPLRYVELLAGYGAVGFRGESALDSSDTRARTLYAGIGLNLTELLERTVFAGDWRGGRTHWFATELLRYVQVPGTAAIGEAHVWRP
jgi:hypothetical protein